MAENRDNQAWIDDLKATDKVRDEALGELRLRLVRGLSAALSGRGGADQAFFEDVTQDSLLKILAALDSFQGKSKFVTWAMTIAVRVAITELRKRRWKDISLELAVDRAATPDKQSQQKAVLDLLNRLIDDDLSEKQRVALRAELNGMPQEEIARRTGSNRNAIYKLMHDARQKLKKGLEKAGYTAAEIQTVFAT